MKTPKMKGPSAADLEGQELSNSLLAKQNAALDRQELERKAETERATQALAGNRVGLRSLLSNGWQGFARGGDLGAKP